MRVFYATIKGTEEEARATLRTQALTAKEYRRLDQTIDTLTRAEITDIEGDVGERLARLMPANGRTPPYSNGTLLFYRSVWRCPLCSQEIDDGLPCGCGARPQPTWHSG